MPSKQKEDSDTALLQRYVQVAKVVAAILEPSLEVIVHDYRRPDSVIAAFNPQVTGRKIGDPLTDMGTKRIKGEDIPDEVLNYKNESPSGRPLKSSSLAIRNDRGDLIGSLCLNFDVSTFQEFSRFIERLCRSSFNEVLHGPERFLPSTPRDDIRSAISEVILSKSWQHRSLTNEQRREVVSALCDRGYFNQKNAVSIVAKELNITRPTVYRYLEQRGEIRT